jgi:hypothetical protein
MIREASTMMRLRVESRLFGYPSRDKLATLDATTDADLSHLYD